MTPAFRYSLLWIVGSLVIVLAALTMISGARIDAQYVPSNPDAFYHARRILDVVMTGGPVAQFDPLIHVPEGSWISWPWGFDTAMAAMVEWFGPFESESDAAAVLLHLPVAMAPLAVGLFLLLCRQLSLSYAATALSTIGFAALPLVFLAFAVGNVDHHFAELLWVLLVLNGGVLFFRSRTVLAGALLGVVLGSAPAVHNGLFILQLPLVMALSWRWLARQTLPPRSEVVALALSLLAATLLVSLKSEPLRNGLFEFYTLSWFHVYVALATATFAIALAVVPFRLVSALAVGVSAVIVTVPLFRNAGLGALFVSGELEVLSGVTEVLSPYELHSLFGPAQSTGLFSWLMWLALPASLANLYWAWRAAKPELQFFAVAAVLFLVLMQLQYRFGVFGIVPLLVTLAIGVDVAARRWRGAGRWNVAVAAVGLAIALTPTREVWTTPRAVGGDPFYADLYPGLVQLAGLCEQRPGVVLAAINDGHWIRYHTACGVIGNVFLLTEQHARKRREVEALLESEPDALRRERPDVAYVLVHGELELFVPVASDGSHGQGILRWKSTTPALVRELLGAEGSLPVGYRVLWSSQLPDGQAFARLLEIER